MDIQTVNVEENFLKYLKQNISEWNEHDMNRIVAEAMISAFEKGRTISEDDSLKSNYEIMNMIKNDVPAVVKRIYQSTSHSVSENIKQIIDEEA